MKWDLAAGAASRPARESGRAGRLVLIQTSARRTSLSLHVWLPDQLFVFRPFFLGGAASLAFVFFCLPVVWINKDNQAGRERKNIKGIRVTEMCCRQMFVFDLAFVPMRLSPSVVVVAAMWEQMHLGCPVDSDLSECQEVGRMQIIGDFCVTGVSRKSDYGSGCTQFIICLKNRKRRIYFCPPSR